MREEKMEMVSKAKLWHKGREEREAKSASAKC